MANLRALLFTASKVLSFYRWIVIQLTKISFLPEQLDIHTDGHKLLYLPHLKIRKNKYFQWFARIIILKSATWGFMKECKTNSEFELLVNIGHVRLVKAYKTSTGYFYLEPVLFSSDSSSLHKHWERCPSMWKIHFRNVIFFFKIWNHFESWVISWKYGVYFEIYWK